MRIEPVKNAEVKIGDLLYGDCFLENGVYYVRIDLCGFQVLWGKNKPLRDSEAACVDLGNGDLTVFDRGTKVQPVKMVARVEPN